MNYSYVIYFWLIICICRTSSAQVITKLFEQTKYDIKKLYMFDANLGWAVGEAHWDPLQYDLMSTILKTTNGGGTWVTQSIPEDNNLWDLHFINMFYGWAAGDSGTILRTMDGGESWMKQSTGTEHNFKSAFFSDSLLGWAVANEPIHFNPFDEPDAWKGRVWSTSDGGATWSEQNFPADAGLIHCLYFQDNQKGWALGVKNESIDVFVDTYGVAYFTENGGQTWVEKFNPELKLVFTDIDFADDQKGWIVGFASSSSENGGTIFRTTDGGENWFRIAENETLWQVDFIDSLKGYACGAKYGAAWGPPVIRTTDGGKNWEKIRMEEHDGQALYGLAVFQDTVIAMGDEGYMAYSTNPWGDYGEHYGEELFTQTLIDTLYEFEDIFFIDEIRGWVAGRKSIGPHEWVQTILHTGDGGRNWKEQYTFRSDLWMSHTLRLDAVQFVNATEGWASGHVVDVGSSQTSGILHTNDGGKTWQQQANGVSKGEIVDLFFFDDQNGWALTNSRSSPDLFIQLLKTTDSGVSWDLINTGQPGLITIGSAIRSGSVFFQDVNTGWVLGAQCDLIKTEDGGKTWSEVPLPEEWVNTYDIVFNSEQRGIICGETIFQTQDAGDQWSENHLIDRSFTDIYFADSINGWMVGEWGNIYHTRDGGDNWTAIDHTASNAALKAVTFCDTQNGWAAGRSGTIIKIDNPDVSGVYDSSDGKNAHLLIRNYPNPFSTQTTINYRLTQSGRVTLIIYDLSGRKIFMLVDDFRPAGIHTVHWDGRDNLGRKVSSGVYICKLKAESGIISKILLFSRSNF